MTVKCTLSVRDWDGRINGKVKVRGMYGHVCYVSCSRNENSAYGDVGIKDDAVRKRLIRGAPWGAIRAPGREGVRSGCHEPFRWLCEEGEERP